MVKYRGIVARRTPHQFSFVLAIHDAIHIAQVVVESAHSYCFKIAAHITRQV